MSADLPRVPSDPRDKPRAYALHGVLFLLTCLTTARVGAEMSMGKGALAWSEVLTHPAMLWAGLPFACSLLAILLSHEMGHFIVARRHGVHATLPYFLPLPVGLIGTLGAVIGMPSARRRDALMDIGAAGPLAGLVVAIPILAYGIAISPIRETSGGLLEGNSVLYVAVKYFVTGRYLPAGGLDVQLHQVAWAGWVGLLVTMLNLMPVGQLDGGHIAYAFFGAQQDRVSLWLHRALVPMGLFVYSYSAWELSAGLPLKMALVGAIAAGSPYIVWTALLALLRRVGGGYHPPVDPGPLSRGRRCLFLLMVVVYAMIFTPIPLRHYLGTRTVRGVP